MDPMLDFLLTITGLRFVFEAVGALLVTLVVLATLTVTVALWPQVARFRARLGSI